MDKNVIYSKLESLRRCVERIRDKTPESAEQLLEDFDLQDIICINLERAIQTCVDIGSIVIAESDLPAPSTMSEVFDQLAKLDYVPKQLAVLMKKAVGFRNIAVHAYQEIDWAIVYSIATKRLADFSLFAKHIAERIAG